MVSKFVVLLATIASSTAHADSLSELLDVVRDYTRAIAPTQEARIEEQLLHSLGAIVLAGALLDNNPVYGGSVEASVIAGGGLDIDRGGAEVAGLVSAHFDGDRCRALSADLLVRGRAATSVDDRARASAEGELGACMPEGIDFSESGAPISAFPIRGRVYGGLNKTPSLLSSRTRIPEQYSEVGFGLWLEGMRWLRDDGKIYYAFPGASIEQKYHWRTSPSGEASRQEVVVDVYFARLARRRPPIALADRAIDILGFDLHGIAEDNGVAIGDFWPLRISGFGFGTDRVLADAVVGVSGTGTITNDDGSVINSADVPDRAIAYVHAALSVGDRRFGGGATYDRGLDTNFLLELVQEDRGTLWVRQQHGAVSYTAAALVTRALHFPDKIIVGEERLVGGSFDGSYALGGGVAVGLSIEATHAFMRDDVLDARVAPDGVRAFATVSYTHVLASERESPPADARSAEQR